MYMNPVLAEALDTELAGFSVNWTHTSRDRFYNIIIAILGEPLYV